MTDNLTKTRPSLRFVVLDCGHTTPQGRTSYVGFPMEWCHTCEHARFVKRWA